MSRREEKLKAVQRMKAHIESHLHQPITLAELARAGRYSLYHAARVFKAQTGKTPFEYIRSRRLAAAAERLRDDRERIIDVAFDFVFDSHEGFTRAFAQEFGMTPSQFRSRKPAVSLFMPAPMRACDQNRQHQKGTHIMSNSKDPKDSNDKVVVFVQIIDRPARKLILKRGQKATHYFEYCDEVGCDVWEQLAAIENAIHEPMGLWLPEKFCPAGTSSYVQGVEVGRNYDQKLPDGLEIIDLPPCKMLVFQGQPFDDEEFESAIHSLWDVMKTYKPETIGYKWADDDAPRFQLEPHGYRGYIEGRPVRPMPK